MSTEAPSVRYNFAPGPAQLPEPVIAQAAEAIRAIDASGRSILELSHRSPTFDAIAQRSEADLRELLGIGDEYAVLFLNGGARVHYGLWPLNISAPDARLGMILTGYWSRLAADEAARFRQTVPLNDPDDLDYPDLEAANVSDLDYAHYVSNETLTGIAMPTPDLSCPLVCDRTSDFLSEPFDIAPYALCYAGGQKTFGCAGLTAVVVRRDLLRTDTELPTGLDYATQEKYGCRYYTPAIYAWYVSSLYLRWIREQGGLQTMAEQAQKRATLLYDCIDRSSLYACAVASRARSRMNVCFTLEEDALHERFLKKAEIAGFAGLRGHVAVGGIRASLYNAMPITGAQALVHFMHEFERTA